MRSEIARGIVSQSRSGAIRGAPTVFSDLAMTLVARLGSAVLSIASVLITTRIFGPADYGLVAYAGITGLIVFAAAAAWTSTAMVRYGREHVDQSGVMRSVTWSRLELSVRPLAFACVAVILVKALGGFPGGFTWILTALALAYGLVLIAADQVIYSLQAIGRMKLSAAALVLQQLIYILGLGLLVITGVGATPVAVVSVFIGASAAVTVALTACVWTVAIWPPARDAAVRRRMFRFSVPMIAFSASQYAIRSVDLIVLGVLAGPAAMGLYAIAYRGYIVLQDLTRASSTVLTPLFVSLRDGGREDVVDRYLGRVVAQMTLIASVALGLAVLVVPVAVPAVFGDAFGGGAEPLAVLLFAALLAFSAQLYSPIIVLHERTQAVGVIGVVAAIVNILGDVVLVGPLGVGIVGPAIATTVAMGIVLVGYARVAGDCTSSDVRVGASMVLPFVAGLGVALAVPGPGAILIGVPAVGLTAAIVILATRPFGHEDAELIGSLDMPVAMKRLTLRTVAIASR